MWEGGKCVPPPPGGEKKICPSFGYEVASRGRRLLRSETEVASRGRRWLIFTADDLLERAARRPAGTASCLHLHALPHRHPLRHRLLAACCFQSIHSGLQQVRVLHKLMPGKGFYMDVLCYLLKAWKRCVMPAAIASCCHGSICALLASPLSHSVWCCSLFMHSLQVSAFCLTQARRGV